MDLSCDYINQQGDCESPRVEGRKTEKCSCSNYEVCFLFPEYNLRTKVPYESANDLESWAKK